MAITWTTAVRTPAAISGRASGSSTRRSTWPPDIPIPRAASRTSRSTSRMPVTALVSSGGTAKSTSAAIAEELPTPSAPTANSVSRPSVGIARAALPTLTARVVNRL